MSLRILIKKLPLRAISIALASCLDFSASAAAAVKPDTAAGSNFEARVAAVREVLANRANPPDSDAPPDRVFQWGNWPNWQNWNNWNNWRNWPNWNNY